MIFQIMGADAHRRAHAVRDRALVVLELQPGGNDPDRQRPLLELGATCPTRVRAFTPISARISRKPASVLNPPDGQLPSSALEPRGHGSVIPPLATWETPT
jgi:hypothetical protein